MKRIIASIWLLLAAFTYAAPIKVLMAEKNESGTAGKYRPAPMSGVTLYDPQGGVGTGISSHATNVAYRIIATGVVKTLEINHDSYYCGKNGLGASRVNFGGFETWPKKGDWLVENHSWGGTDLDWLTLLQRCERRAERDNVVIVIAVPNSGQAIVNNQPLRLLSATQRHTLLVGNANGRNQLVPAAYDSAGKLSWPAGRQPDLVTFEDNSYGSGVVAATAALLISDAIDAGKPYAAAEIRQVLIDSASPNAATPGIGLHNRDAARALWKHRKGI